MTEPQKPPPPPPSLQDLVEQFGGYDKILREVWEKYDVDRKAWQDQIGAGDHWWRKPA
jgi:hypothetical protein